MPVPDLDATVRGLYRAATGEAAWDATLATLRDGLAADDLQVISGAAPVTLVPHAVLLTAPAGGDAPMVQITWPADRPPDAAIRAWLDRLAPHLHDALRAGLRLRQLPQRVALGQLLLERLLRPAWLLQADGRIAWENGEGRKERIGGRWLHDDGARLTPRALAQQRALAVALTSALAAPDGRRVVVPLEPVDAADPTMRAHWLLRRLDPPPAGAEPRALAAEPVLLVVLFDPAQADALSATAPEQATALATVYGFTPAESRVAACVARGATVRQIAVQLDVAPSTIRSHLDAVTAKLGVERKLDAVRLLGQSGWMWRGGEAEGAADA